MLEGIGESEHEPDVVFFDDPEREDELWQVRESGLGATAHVPHRPDTWEGWEDSAVPVDRLGGYLRDLRGLYEEFGYASDVGPSLYGHFGQGCVHTRIPFDLYSAEGVATYRRFLERAAELVASYGGSLSGEHGDGQTRGELLTTMFGDEVVALFGEAKALFDPLDRMNPGKVVHPARLDAHLRLGGSWAPKPIGPLFFGYPHDGHSFREAANRCVGVGKCRKHENDGGTVMCPSYQVTHEEKHSTRGRARLLFEMLDGHGDGPIKDGWRSSEVKEALDLCLACKGCKTDCPANVDMATYKAEFLAHHYRHRIRPRADLATGWVPLVARLVTGAKAAGTLNAVTRVRPLARLATRAAGLEDRPIPQFATETLQQGWGRRLPDAAGPSRGTRGSVLLWPDTFTNYFPPEVGRAAVSPGTQLVHVGLDNIGDTDEVDDSAVDDARGTFDDADSGGVDPLDLVDWSEHGIGRYQDPLGVRDEQGRRIWIREAWDIILALTLNRHQEGELPVWAQRTALTQFTLTTPRQLDWFGQPRNGQPAGTHPRPEGSVSSLRPRP